MKARGDAGITLIEVMVALVVFSIGSLAVAKGMIVAVSADLGAGEQTRAVALAVQKIEEIKATPIADVQSSGPETIDVFGRPAENGPYAREVEIVEEVEGPHTKGVTVRVSYLGGDAGDRTARLYTILYQE